MDIVSYVLSKRYVDETVAGAGAIKGAPCQIQSIEPVEDGNNITFLWKLEDGTTRTSTIFVRNGADGANGKDGINGIDGAAGKPGKDGVDGEDGVDGVGIDKIEQTAITSENGKDSLLTVFLTNGTQYSFTITTERGLPGKDGIDGVDGNDGKDGINGQDGRDGATPEIGDNGHWVIDGVDTGVVAAPDLSSYYSEDNFVPLTDAEIDQLCAEEEEN
jgi:hypothetical protein